MPKDKNIDKSFLANIAKMKKQTVIQKEEKGVIKPIQYKAISFNITTNLFWLFREYCIKNKNTAKSIFNDAVDMFLDNPKSINIQERDLDDESKQKFNIKIKIENLDRLRVAALDNRVRLTDIYLAIIKSIV